jgi:hypothetical protein
MKKGQKEFFAEDVLVFSDEPAIYARLGGDLKYVSYLRTLALKKKKIRNRQKMKERRETMMMSGAGSSSPGRPQMFAASSLEDVEAEEYKYAAEGATHEDGWGGAAGGAAGGGGGFFQQEDDDEEERERGGGGAGGNSTQRGGVSLRQQMNTEVKRIRKKYGIEMTELERSELEDFADDPAYDRILEGMTSDCASQPLDLYTKYLH